MAKMELSIRGLYLIDNTIFDNLTLPAALDANTAIATILHNCAELEVLYPDADMMKESIGYWSARRAQAWDMYYASLFKEDYDPFTDYDRNESYSDTETRNLASTSSLSSNSTEKTKGFNESALQAAAGSEGSGNTSGTDTGTVTHSRTIHQYGNSALGTNQDIITKEIQLRQKYEIYELIANEFKHDFCLVVY